MRNFSIQFTYPWLLLLLIPAAALTVFLYLRLNKRYRRNRNRITSIVLHSIVMLLCILVLSGMTFNYEVGNEQNELILLVDVSDTTQEVQDRRNEFIHSVLTEGEYEDFRLGIVTFGFGQNSAVPFTYSAEEAFESYLSADLPDTTATDIAAALSYARTLFEHPDTGKIVLVSDGKETDEAALSVIRAVTAQGVTVDTVYLDTDYADDTVQIVGTEMPDYNVKVGESCAIGVTISSKEYISGATVEFYDNGSLDETDSVVTDIVSGVQVIQFNHVFHEEGLHELRIRVKDISDADEALDKNNEFYSYWWLQAFKNVLIIQQAEQSQALVEMLETDEVGYEIQVADLSGDIPESVDELRQYDQVILNNISSHDLEAHGLDEMLYDYVYNYGGGLFTTGGTEADGTTAHAYNRADMNNTLYQQMLPVQAINYVPPVGVFIVIDISGSMLSESTGGLTKLEWAKQGAIECLNALTERDYIGIMTMDTDYGMVLDLTPCTQDALIREKILGIGQGLSTIYSTAIDRSAQRLANLPNVDKRHIVLVTDGMPSSSDETAYMQNTANAFNNHGITLSVVGINISEGSEAATKMTELVTVGHGRLHLVNQGAELLAEMREELNAPEIEETKYEEFYPYIADSLSPLLNGVERGADFNDRNTMKAPLNGFFGVKARQNAETILVGDYEVPIYSQWKFGKGTVGSFMCDVYSSWSSAFMADDNGRRFLLNVVANLMPTEDIRPSSIRIDLKEQNYINNLSVYTTLDGGEYLNAKLTKQTENGEEVWSLNELSAEQTGNVYVTLALGAANNYSRATFVLKEGGVYTLTVDKCDANGNVIDSATIFKSFAYSSEYDLEQDEDAARALMEELAEKGKGAFISEEEPWEVFSTFITEIERVFDPRILFMILAMVLFLLDIAVRKFKFKWPHELIREHRAKKEGGKG